MHATTTRVSPLPPGLGRQSGAGGPPADEGSDDERHGSGIGDPGDLQHDDALEDLPEETGADSAGAAGSDGTAEDPGEQPIEPGDVIDITEESGPALTTGVDDIDTGSSGGHDTAASGPAP